VGPFEAFNPFSWDH